MEPEFITYQKFNDAALADELAEQLEKHDIKCFVAEEAHNFNPSFAFNDVLSTDYAVKIKNTDFEKANKFLKRLESELVSA